MPNTAAHLEELGVAPLLDDVAEAVLSALGTLYEAWLVQPFVHFLPEYHAHNSMCGCTVLADAGGVQVEGAFVGIDEQGRLLLRQQDGHVARIVSGEAHICAVTFQ